MTVAVRPLLVDVGQLEALVQEFNDVFDEWARQGDVDDTGCMLVRPDRFVAWRRLDGGLDPTARHAAALRQLLGG